MQFIPVGSYSVFFELLLKTPFLTAQVSAVPMCLLPPYGGAEQGVCLKTETSTALGPIARKARRRQP